MIEFLQRAATRTGFERDFFIEKNIPTVSSNITIFPFFGDLRATFVLSAFLLRRYKELTKYLILASWPGQACLFPYVDEYWSLKNVDEDLAFSANNFYNGSNTYTNHKRNLIQHFENVIDHEQIKPYYDNGFTPNLCGNLKRYFPEIPSSSRLPDAFRQELNRRSGQKVVIYPAQHLRSWQQGKIEYMRVSKDFWLRLIERLLSEDIMPVIYQNRWTYDLSVFFADRCMYIVDKDLSQVLSAFRAVGCVLDVHTGISRLAIAARCPFLAVDEHMRYESQKEYEIDDLTCEKLPKQVLFHFSTLLMTGSPTDWNTSLIDNVIIRLKKFLPELHRDQLPSVTESYEDVSYECVRRRKSKKFGVHFIRKRKNG